LENDAGKLSHLENDAGKLSHPEGQTSRKGGVKADGVASLIVAAGERRGLLGVGFENMMRSWVMK